MVVLGRVNHMDHLDVEFLFGGNWNVFHCVVESDLFHGNTKSAR